METHADFLAAPKNPPALNIPHSDSIARVSIINSTSDLQAPLEVFMGPIQEGHTLNCPAFSFLIEHSSGRKLLFDLGTRKDWENFPPAILGLVKQPGWGIKVEKDVAQILQENGIDAAGGAIEAIIWSHWHYDHIGDPSTFPGSTALIVGPGVKEAFLPAYPANPESPLLETDFAGRELKVVNFDLAPNRLELGRFKAVDFFGDGSFYLIDSPGHAIGHLCGLARVSNEGNGTFVFMGGDAAHHGGMFRPSEYLPLPKTFTPSIHRSYQGSCPGHLFEKIHPNKSAKEPFYRPSESMPVNYTQAIHTIEKMEEFDAADNVFVVIAHDASLLREEVGIEWFPYGTLKDWRRNDLASKARWGFLKDFEHAVDAASCG